jgi:HD-like signal output (HDOD) protein
MVASEGIEVNRRRALKCLDDLEPFSPVVARLLSTFSTDPDKVSLGGIGDLIEKDTVLSGKVLALANSAYYGRGTEIVSIHRAVARLGLNKVRNTVLALSINRVWKNAKTPIFWSMLRFNLHSLATAVAADLLAMRVPTYYGEGAFIAGLFHDLGRLVIAVMLQGDYENVCHAAKEEQREVKDQERLLLGFDHSELSADIVGHWNLPAAIKTAVEFHESPELDTSPVKDSFSRLSKVIHIADRYAGCLGISIVDGSTTVEEDPLQMLGTTEAQMKLFPDFKSQFDLLRNM